jgi:FAD/FMN-containing dehydrogenase
MRPARHEPKQAPSGAMSSPPRIRSDSRRSNGFAGTVGVSGYMLGGGIGWLVRQYGAAVGSLRSAELVTADGRLMEVNEQNHADLFWGLRGGGGNFAIVTSFEFDLYPVKEIFGGSWSIRLRKANRC